jgi:hypothetical protein
MPRKSAIVMSGLLIVAMARPAAAWPAEAYAGILERATRTLPAALQQLFTDLDPVFSLPCETTNPVVIEPAVELAIRELTSASGDLRLAVRAMREIGCGAAAMNAPSAEAAPDMDRLVISQIDNFAVVFYGWHPLIQSGNLGAYLETRTAEHQRLRDRLERTSELPNLSDQVEMSPEFGIAALAFSHAITDVANVWMYVWAAVNGAP